MNTKRFLILGITVLASSLCGPALAGEMQARYVRLAEIEIDPAQLESYKAAVKEEIETSRESDLQKLNYETRQV